MTGDDKDADTFEPDEQQKKPPKHRNGLPKSITNIVGDSTHDSRVSQPGAVRTTPSPRNKTNSVLDLTQSKINFVPSGKTKKSALLLGNDDAFNANMASARIYTINGVQVRFPYKAYPSQIAMMGKIIRAAKDSQNALLESPTGTGKTVTLLSAILAWCEAERTRITMARIERRKATFDSEKNAAAKPSSSSMQTLPDAKPTHASGQDRKDALPLSLNKTAPAESTTDSESRSSQRSDLRTVPEHASSKMHNDDDDDDFVDGTFVQIHKRPSKSGRSDTLAGAHDHSQIDHRSGNLFDSAKKMSDSDPAATKLPHDSIQDKEDFHNADSEWMQDKVPKIYIASRTQKQIKQMINELKTKTSYRPKTAILASRDFYCINPRFKTSINKNDDCRNALKYNACDYFNRYKSLQNHPSIRNDDRNVVWDIEDLVKVGKSVRGCPYYASRDIADRADVVFAPYNYFIDPLVRGSSNIQLANNIMIIDEAHNVESVCTDSASIDLTESVLQDCIREIETISKHTDRVDQYKLVEHVLKGVVSWRQQFGNDFHTREFDRSSRLFHGHEIMRLLAGISITPDSISVIKKAIEQIGEDPINADRNRESTDIALSTRTVRVLEAIDMVFGFIVNRDHDHSNDYCMLYYQAENHRRGNGDSPWVYGFAFWCLNPAVIFRRIANEARSVVLTSGTLSPLNTFTSELGAEFAQTLEAGHVIKEDQLVVGVIATGTDNQPLTGTFQNAETYEYQDQIGLIIYRIASITPEGMLVFLPSYGALDKLINRWTSTGLYQKLSDVKTIYEEPRSTKKDLDAFMSEYYTACQSPHGAILFCIHRGKMSEGIDFADYRARCVVCVGLPFPSLKDQRIKEKRDYNTRFASTRGLLKGNEWYEIQAYRAINQAIGRCIRHRHDWGAMILLDHRFTMRRNLASISKWIRSRAVVWPSLVAAETQLKSFFEYRNSDECRQRIAQQVEQEREQLARERQQRDEWQRKQAEEDAEKKANERKQKLGLIAEQHKPKKQKTEIEADDAIQDDADVVELDATNAIPIGGHHMRKQLDLSKFRYTSERTDAKKQETQSIDHKLNSQSSKQTSVANNHTDNHNLYKCTKCNSQIARAITTRIPIPPFTYISQFTHATTILLIESISTTATNEATFPASIVDQTESTNLQSPLLNALWSNEDAIAFDHSVCGGCGVVVAVRMLAFAPTTAFDHGLVRAMCSRWLLFDDAVKK